MVEYGYALSSEEFGPRDLVRWGARAEEAGFPYALISDHFHPWTDSQGQSPFVWSVLGGIAERTERLRIGTGVTCPTIRTHPAIIAQAAATTALMFEDRFFLGVGTGENLNEHILGDHWPRAEVRLQMLEEAIEVMRKLWEGEFVSHEGEYYEVQDARIYSCPAKSIPVYVAASGENAAELAGRIGDALISTSPDEETVRAFEEAGGKGKPKIGQVALCWAPSPDEAKATAHRVWPNAAITGELSQELPLPRHFEQAAKMVSVDDVAEAIPCGPDPGPVVESIGKFVEAGFDHVYLHQIGPDQEGFFRFFEAEVRPKLPG